MSDEIAQVGHLELHVIQASGDSYALRVVRARDWEQLLVERGAVLFRGFNITSVDAFRTFCRDACGDLVEYTFDTTPRTDLGGGVYTSTEHAAWVPIHVHNECAYQRSWPLKIAFGCLERPLSGGQALLTDIRAVTRGLHADIKTEFRDRRLQYLRNFRQKVGLPWEKVFHTTDKGAVARYCLDRSVQFEWLSDDWLRTRHVAQALAIHPLTGDELWFNQAHTFHISAMDDKTKSALVSMYAEDELPRNVLYGDGSAIDADVIREIKRVLALHTVSFEWSEGDVLILDNMQTAHGRVPYKGTRRVVVAMADVHTPAWM